LFLPESNPAAPKPSAQSGALPSAKQTMNADRISVDVMADL